MISFIIPVLDEAALIGCFLDHLSRFCPPHEVIVCDGGSGDGTLAEIARRPWVRLVRAPRPGRGQQMNLGAAAARGGVLVFLHADLMLPPDAPEAIDRALASPAVVGGGFRKRYRDAPALLRLAEWGLNSVRAALARDFVGTNAIFARSDVFGRMGGFRDWPLLEDVDFSDRLKRQGALALLDGPVEVSSRKYRADGTLARVAVNARVMAGYRLLGETPATLLQLYRRPAPRRASPLHRIPELVSVVIPTLDEESCLADCLRSIVGQAHTEVVVADGGSRDRTEAICKQFPGVRFLDVGSRGRAVQMNAGAAATSGEILVFLHADTVLPPGAPDRIREAMSAGAIAAGAFDITFDGRAWIYRLLERLSNLRNRLLGMPYGDQALFVRREAFRALGGFPDRPFLEDLELSRRLKASGPIRFLSRPGVRTSARRFISAGPVLGGLRNCLVLALYLLGVAPERLATLYRK